ncbi:MAG TPA: hypothetical protein VFG23_19190 [Polyangia bacterium]|nr:hypothetical protein [Polyangia bacterium]
MTFEVVKLGYSVRPWRIVEKETGREVWTHAGFDHPILGMITVPTPLSFDRKRDATAALCDLAASSVPDETT